MVILYSAIYSVVIGQVISTSYRYVLHISWMWPLKGEVGLEPSLAYA